MTEKEALQVLEIILRPGIGQADPSVAHKVLVSYMGQLDVPIYNGEADEEGA